MINPGEAIIFEDGRTYICACNLKYNDKKYLYLVTIDEPIKVCFAEQITNGERPQIQVVSNKALKSTLFEAFQIKIQKAVESLNNEN